jgi:tRNA pseudouridine38-40 synthase
VQSREEIRCLLVVHYDGSRFFGWQVQREERTVQQALEDALERLTEERRTVTGAGRTDRGVHSTGQVAAVTLPARWSAASIRKALNAVLPRDVWIAEAREVRPDFHPRYDAVARSYEYRIGLGEEAFSPFHRPWCWPLAEELSMEHLEAAAGYLTGEHSFRAFAKTGQPERGDRCTVARAAWVPWADLGTTFTITANRYLHHMVRYLVGTMVDIGRGRRPLDDLPALLAGGAEDGAAGGPGFTTSPPAPPEGLFLTRVAYPAGADRTDTYPQTESGA